MTTREVRAYCQLDRACRQLLKSSVNEMGLSARAHDKALRVARTIADRNTTIQEADLMEAVNYRVLDRQLWQ